MPQVSSSTFTTAGVAHDRVRCGVVLAAVHAAHEGRDFLLALGGSRDEHALGARVEVLARILDGGEETGRLEHVVDALRLPRELGRVLDGGAGGRLAVDDDRLAVGAHLGAEAAVGRVVLEQVGKVVGRDQVVDAHDLEATALVGDAVDEAADATEAIDCETDCHGVLLPSGVLPPSRRTALAGPREPGRPFRGSRALRWVASGGRGG
jgi:hypothetical protein